LSLYLTLQLNPLKIPEVICLTSEALIAHAYYQGLPFEDIIMEVTLFWIGALLIALIIDLWLLVSINRSNKGTSAKIGWCLLVVLLPVAGWVIWGIAGPRGVTRAPTSPEHSKG
jgi:hypothetical protein